MDASRRRLLAILALFVVPWTFVDTGGQPTLVFPFGFVTFGPLVVEDVVSYVTVDTFGLPQFLLAWPVGVGVYLLAVASALSGVFLGREDRRVTALLLVLVALTQVRMSLGFAQRFGTVAVPIGVVLILAVVWWYDWATLRNALPASR